MVLFVFHSQVHSRAPRPCQPTRAKHERNLCYPCYLCDIATASVAEEQFIARSQRYLKKSTRYKPAPHPDKNPEEKKFTRFIDFASTASRSKRAAPAHSNNHTFRQSSINIIHRTQSAIPYKDLLDFINPAPGKESRRKRNLQDIQDLTTSTLLHLDIVQINLTLYSTSAASASTASRRKKTRQPSASIAAQKNL